jgi:20S proteasome alpha/beta subunit
MTVLIGLRCKDGAVFACDSQESRANYFRYWPKTGLFENQFVILYAGNPTIGEAFFRRLSGGLRALMKEGQIEQSRATQLIEEHLLSLSKEAGEDAVKGRQLLIAGVTNLNEVCLWAVDSNEIYLREMRTWECYGSGIDAAEMLMKDFYYQEISTKEAIPLLAYVVHAVSDICIDCGGPTSVVVVNKQGVKELSDEEVESSLSSVKSLLDKMRKELPKLLLKGQLTEDKIKGIKGN